MKKIDIMLNMCQNEINSGKNETDVIGFMFSYGLSITDSIKIFQNLYDVTLDEAKERVVNHEEWQKLAEESDETHKKLITDIEKLLADE